MSKIFPKNKNKENPTKLTKLNDLVQNNETLKGRWVLSENHAVHYRKDGKDEEIKLKAPILGVEPNALLLSFTEKEKDQKLVTRIFKLTGSWKLDPKNRIVFEVKKEGGRNDLLTFNGAWHIGPQNQLIYAYKERGSKTKDIQTHRLIFTGFWDISGKHRLTYWLDKDSNSAFRFRGAFQTTSILAKKGEIRYQIGLEINGKHQIQEIVLFGKWKVSRNLALLFEMEYEDGKRKAILFGGEVHPNPSTQISVHLKSQEGKPLGLQLLLTKDFFPARPAGGRKDGQAFLKLQRTLEERRIEGGLRFRW